jgi:hypothetical protein
MRQRVSIPSLKMFEKTQTSWAQSAFLGTEASDVRLWVQKKAPAGEDSTGTRGYEEAWERP